MSRCSLLLGVWKLVVYGTTLTICFFFLFFFFFDFDLFFLVSSQPLCLHPSLFPLFPFLFLSNICLLRTYCVLDGYVSGHLEICFGFPVHCLKHSSIISQSLKIGRFHRIIRGDGDTGHFHMVTVRYGWVPGSLYVGRAGSFCWTLTSPLPKSYTHVHLPCNWKFSPCRNLICDLLPEPHCL